MTNEEQVCQWAASPTQLAHQMGFHLHSLSPHFKTSKLSGTKGGNIETRALRCFLCGSVSFWLQSICF